MIVVIGDILLDRDVRGSVKRLAPDAPVPVLSDVHESVRLGGAGLAATRIIDEGEQVTLVTALGDDSDAAKIRSLARRWGIDLIVLPTRAPTRVKQRFGTSEQLILRVDGGDERCAPHRVDVDPIWIAVQQADALLVSDYGGGVTDNAVIRELIARVAEEMPVIWDPHPRGATPVSGCALITPNRSEAGLSSTVDPGTRARELATLWGAPVVITLGAAGAVLGNSEGASEQFAASAVDGDPCGAGDAFAAAASIALAQGDSREKAVLRAVSSATQWVAGDKEQPKREIVVATGGCFDLLHVGHIATLQAARDLGDRLIVLINSDRSIRELKGPDRPLNGEAERAKVLRALSIVDDVIIFDEETPEHALRNLKPDVWVKGGDYAVADLPESRLMTQWGGRTVIVPYLPGHSTTHLAEQVRHIDLRSLNMETK